MSIEQDIIARMQALQDVDDVAERLTWEDDDIVIDCGLNYMRRDFSSKFDGPCVCDAKDVNRYVGLGAWKILRPFLSSDGVRFEP